MRTVHREPHRDRTGWTLPLIALVATTTLGACAPASMQQMQPDEAPDKNYCPGRLEKAQQQIREAYRAREEGDFRDGRTMEAGVTGPFGESVQVTIRTDMDAAPEDDSRFVAKTGLSDLVFNCSEPGGTENRCAFSVYLDGKKVLTNSEFVRGQMEIRCLRAGRHELRLARQGHTVAKRMIDLESDVEHLVSVNGTGPDMTIEIYARNPLPDRVPTRASMRAERQRDERDRQRRRRDRRDRHHDHDHGDDHDDYGDGYGDGYGDDYGEDRDRDHDHDHDDHHGDHDHHGHAMDSADFAELLQQVKEAGFSDERLGLVRTAAKDNWFTAEQAKRLVAQFDFKDPKVEAAVALHPRIVDKGNFFKVLDVFDFSSAKEEVRKRTGYED